MITCKNCTNEFIGNYCPECGQKAKTSKIDAKYLQEEAKYTFLHLNNGFFFTTKELLTRPGHATREYIEGKRVKHYKPLLFLFVVAGLYGFLLTFVDYKELYGIKAFDTSAQVGMEWFDWTMSHYSLFELLYLPITSLASWLAFRKWGYNFLEHLIINCYAAGLRLAVYIVTLPILYISKGTLFIFIVSSLVTIATFMTTAWLFVQFFSDKPLDKVILRILLLIFNYIIFTIAAAIIGGIVYGFIKYAA